MVSRMYIYIYIHTLWWTNIAMENHHFSWENPLFLWPFSIAMLVHQRVTITTIPKLDFEHLKRQIYPLSREAELNRRYGKILHQPKWIEHDWTTLNCPIFRWFNDSTTNLWSGCVTNFFYPRKRHQVLPAPCDQVLPAPQRSVRTGSRRYSRGNHHLWDKE